MSRSSHQINQNVDNFIGNRSSTRLHAAPGGSSTMGSLIYGGGGGGADDYSHQSHGRRAFNRNNATTSLSGPSKGPSSGPESHNYGSRQHETNNNSHFGNGYSNSTVKEPTRNSIPGLSSHHQSMNNQPGAAPANSAPTRDSSNVFASGASQNTGNFITNRRTTRVHAPPGGKSNFTLG